jgi:NTP pyrophosphatase (non-canonical NTP hydrolase)
MTKTTDQEHQEMVQVLKKDGQDIINELTPELAHLLHMAVGVSGEAGELLDAIKKITIYRKDIDKENIIEELGDIEFFLEGIRKVFNITREATLQHNINKLAKRYKEKKFSNAAAQQRADKICTECEGTGRIPDQGGSGQSSLCFDCNGTGILL